MDRLVPNESVIESLSEDGPNSGALGDSGGSHDGETNDPDDDYCDEDGAEYIAYLLRESEATHLPMPFLMETREGGNYSGDLRPIMLVAGPIW